MVTMVEVVDLWVVWVCLVGCNCVRRATDHERWYSKVRSEFVLMICWRFNVDVHTYLTHLGDDLATIVMISAMMDKTSHRRYG